jgi:DNA-binding CsgD family transcriptional regulator
VRSPGADPRQIADALRELRQVHRELTERELVRRADARDEVQGAVEELAEIGSSAVILERAAETLGRSSSFARVLVSQVDGDRLIPRSFWERTEVAAETTDAIAGLEVALRYPLIEAEVVQRGGEATAVDATGPRSPAALRDLFGWRRYVVAPVRLRETPIGLLHAESDAPGEIEVELVEAYAEGLVAAFERAVLRETVQRHREELQDAVRGIGNHLEEASPDLEPGPSAVELDAVDDEVERLTPRESEILQMMGGGQTNGAIATSLLISESTVKFHVKNILLKLGATNRADAVARHLRGGG